jgi:formylglycine-generating enzyme required for sulfatase activity
MTTGSFQPTTLIAIPGATFTMGCDPSTQTQLACPPYEIPAHQVTLSPYQIERTEVTQSQYLACVQACVCTLPLFDFTPDSAPNHPVGAVLHDQAVTYCSWIGRRLPTEAEWEYAARGNDKRVYPWGNMDPPCQSVLDASLRWATWLYCGMGSSVDVGTHNPMGDSPFGVKDMAGNVWEWVSGRFYYYTADPETNPQGNPDPAWVFVWRGGGFAHGPTYLRTTQRYPTDSIANGSTGFRCAANSP